MTTSYIFDFTGKVVLTTGGSRGLGRAMALGFAEAGADVAVTSRKLEACEAVCAEIEALGRQAFAWGCNVGDWQMVNELIDAVYDRFGKVDILINNAGMSPHYDTVAGISEALYDKVLGVNLKGPFRLCAEVGRRMAEGDGGSIINISSVGAIRPRTNAIPYAAAKAGLNIITEAFADAYGPKVRVNCIMPGPFLTDVSRAWDAEAFRKRAEETMAMKRGGQPEEVVAAALYLASPFASFTTAAILKIDGGAH
jgi:NAD(P)-dependent dehydrogenase (short-subunit alcohol dehydrogenase family)